MHSRWFFLIQANFDAFGEVVRLASGSQFAMPPIDDKQEFDSDGREEGNVYPSAFQAPFQVGY